MPQSSLACFSQSLDTYLTHDLWRTKNGPTFFNEWRESEALAREALQLAREISPTLTDRRLREYVERIAVHLDEDGDDAPRQIREFWHEAKAAFRAGDVRPDEPAKAEKAGESKDGRKTKTKGRRIDERMQRTLTEKPESRDWSAKKWAYRLDCSKSTVGESSTWKSLMVVREAARREASDRYRGDIDVENPSGARHGCGGGRQVNRKSKRMNSY